MYKTKSVWSKIFEHFLHNTVLLQFVHKKYTIYIFNINYNYLENCKKNLQKPIFFDIIITIWEYALILSDDSLLKKYHSAVKGCSYGF